MNMRDPCLCLFILQSQPHPWQLLEIVRLFLCVCCSFCVWNVLPPYLSVTGVSQFFRSQVKYSLLRSSLLTFFKVASPHCLILYDLYSVTLLVLCSAQLSSLMETTLFVSVLVYCQNVSFVNVWTSSVLVSSIQTSVQ